MEVAFKRLLMQKRENNYALSCILCLKKQQQKTTIQDGEQCKRNFDFKYTL